MTKFKIAILDDYQGVSLQMADWSLLERFAEITVFHDHPEDEDVLAERLKPFDIISAMRERTPFGKALLLRLPHLKLLVSTGTRNASIDSAAAEALGIQLEHTGYIGSGAPELTWALLMAITKHIPQENASLRKGGWQTGIGTDLRGKTIGIIGLGRIGARIASIANAFDMRVMAWSENLTQEKASSHGAEYVTKEYLLQQADFVTLHLVLSARSKGVISTGDLALMKKSAFLINTSRGPLVDEKALIHALENHQIAGAGLDVFDQEPLPPHHPFRNLPNVLATPHIGYVTEDTYRLFFQDTVRIIQNWMEQWPQARSAPPN